MILIGLGANLHSRYGAPEVTLKACVSSFEKYDIDVVVCSSIWKSAPVPASDQPWYRNAVCRVKTRLTPQELLRTIGHIEYDFGRERTDINAPRTLDLDILCYDDLRVNQDDLVLPHPRMHERAFVLLPLAEIAPNWVHPVLNKTAAQLLETIPQGQDIEKL